MRVTTKVLAAVTAVGLAATLSACSSSSKPKPVGQFKTLTGQSTSVALDSGFVSALTTLKLTPGLIGSASMSGTTVSFPITGGNATIYKKGAVKPYVQGTIDHQGSGLSLTGGGVTVKLENFVVHPGNDSSLTGEVVAGGQTMQNVTLFNLDGSTLQTPTISSAGVATLTGTRVLLSDGAAKLLDSTFKTTAVKGGLLIGIATIKATGK